MNHKDILKAAVGIVVVVGFFAVLAVMLWQRLAGVDLLVGGLVSAFTAVVMYWYGSSASSDKKTDLLARAPPIIEDKPQ